MPTLAGDIISAAQGLLNDPSGSIYPTQALIPLTNKAYKELQVKLSALGISTTKEVTELLPVPANTVAITVGAGLPPDLLYPIFLSERETGTENLFADMEERDWEPNAKPGTMLGVWVWREDAIHFVGATTSREILLRYIKSLGTITDVNSAIAILNSELWLGQRVAALAALLLGSNPTRASALMTDLNASGSIWDDLRSTLIRRKQNIPVRRRRTRWRRLN